MSPPRTDPRSAARPAPGHHGPAPVGGDGGPAVTDATTRIPAAKIEAATTKITAARVAAAAPGAPAEAAAPGEDHADRLLAGLNEQAWFVTRIPCPQVMLFPDHATVDGQRIELGSHPSARAAAVEHLRAAAFALRGHDGAIRASVRAADSDDVWPAIVTARGEVFDDTGSFDLLTIPKKAPSWKELLGYAAGLVALLALFVSGVLALTQTSPPAPAAVAAPPPTGTPTEYPQLPPVGYATRADWSAPIAEQSVPLVSATGPIITVTDGHVVGLDPKTGVSVWSSPLPQAASTATTPGGLHLSVIDGQESVATTSSKALWWWPVGGSTHDPRSVELPTGATVSFAGSAPLITVPGQHAQLLAAGVLHDYVVPAGAIALGAQGDTITAANSVGQVWSITAATAAAPPASWQVPAPAGASGLDTVAGFAAPFGAGGPERHAVLVTTWYTADANTRLVVVVDAAARTASSAAVTVPAQSVSGQPFAISPHGVLGVLGELLVNASNGHATVLSGWQSRAVNDDAAYGLVSSAASGVTPAGKVSSTGSGVIPIGTAGDMSLVTSTVQNVRTLYGLPAATTSPVPTPSMTVPAPAPMGTAGPTPQEAPSPAPPQAPPAASPVAPPPPPAPAPGGHP